METSLPAATGETKDIRRVQAVKGRPSHGRIYNSGKSVAKPARLHLSFTDAASLIAAVQYGASRHRHWRGITVNLTMLDAPQATEATLRALTDHIRHWQERNGVPPFWAWVREQGALRGTHVHIIAAAPDGTGRALSNALTRWLRGPSIRGEVARGTLHTRPTTAAGWLGYVCKTLTPTDAAALFAQTGIRIISEKPGGPVIGQRRGVARCLGPKAREADALRMYCGLQHELASVHLPC
ncbi:MAG: hypothetical protein HY985_17810 [Magnetospirillum sp.]|nr:hypothetical protein [Magnetospirillum sp.]